MSPPAPYGLVSMTDDLGARFRSVTDANLYMTLGTADEAGTPWASPVYFARSDYRVQAPAELRLYRAIATEHWVLDSRDIRRPVSV